MKRLLLLLLLSSCIQTEVLHAPITKNIDTSVYRPPKPPRDTTRIPIGFDVSVEEWEGKDIEL